MSKSITVADFQFSQLHIEVARNSTDDFNLFHDKKYWQQILGNPFNGPIALGFQLECLIEYQLLLSRRQTSENTFISDYDLQFSNYQFTFADVVRPNQPVSLEIRKSLLNSGENPSLSNRISLKHLNKPILFGFKKETPKPLFLAEIDLGTLPDLTRIPDRSFFSDNQYFLKRKYMSVGNAKNFIAGSLAEQSDYFNEIEDKFIFPETFPVSLISCALLERATKESHNFKKEPMVYHSHRFSIDRRLSLELKSNDQLNILLAPVEILEAEAGLRGTGVKQQLCRCFGVLSGNRVLFRAEISMVALQDILK